MWILDKLGPVAIAVVATQVLAQRFYEMRKPNLEMVPEAVQPGSWKIFDGKTGIVQSELPYHVWKLKVQHKKIPQYLAWLIRYIDAALQCEADLTFYDSKDTKLFTMQGRWVNTPEVSLISPFIRQEKIIYPDRIDIGYDSPEPLDCIVKIDDDEKVVYGWNNEAYAATDAKNPTRYKLGIGTYKVHVRLSGKNFRQFTTKFIVVISADWQETSLTLAEDQG
jgi:hypothetical protein